METVKSIDWDLGKRWGLGRKFIVAFLATMILAGVWGFMIQDEPGGFALGWFGTVVGGIGSIVSLVLLITDDTARIRRYRNAAVALEAKHSAAADAIMDAIKTLTDKSRVGQSKTARALRGRLEGVILKQLPGRDPRFQFCFDLQFDARAFIPPRPLPVIE